MDTSPLYALASGGDLLPPDLSPKTPAGPDSGLPRGWSAEGAPGPELPPMDPHLRNTPLVRLQEMFAHVLIQGLKDRDTAWVNDPAFLLVCDYAGLQGDTPLQIRALYNEGKLNMARLLWWNAGAQESVA
jgi:hypothetical protein